MRTKASPGAQPSDFAGRCYKKLALVPRGKVTTYAELAKAMGTKGYRAVGMVLNCNPYAPKVPCHRVVMTSGKIGGYAKGVRKKIALLEKEGIRIHAGKIENFQKVLFRFK